MTGVCVHTAVSATVDRRAIDTELIRRCAAGDARALEELVQRYQAPIYRFLCRQVRAREDAEEMAVEVFTRVWRNAGRFRFEASVETWLYRIALNLVRDAYQRARVRPDLVPMGACPEMASFTDRSAEDVTVEKMDRAVRARALHEALLSLSESDRAVLTLYYLEDKSYEEMQAALGVAYTVLKTRLARARTRLMKALSRSPHFSDASSLSHLHN